MKKFVSCFLALLLALTALSGLAMVMTVAACGCALGESAAHEITSEEFPLYRIRRTPALRCRSSSWTA